MNDKRVSCSEKGRITAVLQRARSMVLLSLMILLAACSGIHVSSNAQNMPVPHTTASSDTGDTISFAHIDETPSAGAVTVDVTLLDFKVFSSVTTFQVGTPYYFVVTNQGPSVHEFAIFPDKADGSPLPMDVQYVNRLLEIEQVAPGSTIKLNYIFSKVGRDEIACQMRGHYQAGMHLSIAVLK